MTQKEAIVAGGVAGGMYATVGIFLLAFCVLLIIAEWKIFTKAGEAGWKSLIPIYNVYIAFKIAKMHIVWFFVMLVSTVLYGFVSASQVTTVSQTIGLIGIIGLAVVEVVYAIYLANAFGKGTGFKVGLIFLPNIFTKIANII